MAELLTPPLGHRIVVEYELTGTVITTGVQASVTVIAVLRIRDGLIKHWREYQDIPAITEALTRQPGGART